MPRVLVGLALSGVALMSGCEGAIVRDHARPPVRPVASADGGVDAVLDASMLQDGAVPALPSPPVVDDAGR